jgi:hypothetical protein
MVRDVIDPALAGLLTYQFRYARRSRARFVSVMLLVRPIP